MTEVTAVFSRVGLPTFSKIQDELGRLRRAYLRILQVVMFASTPLALGLLLVAPDFVDAILGAQWLPMVRALQILLLWGWIRSFRATTGPVLQARGRPDLVTKFTLFKVVVLAVLVVPFSLRWGIEGTSWAVVIAAAAEVPLLLVTLHREMGAGYQPLLARLLRPVLLAAPMAVVVLVWQALLFPGGPQLIRLVVSVMLGAAVYLSLALFFDRRQGWGLWNDIQRAAGHNLEPVTTMVRDALDRRPA
jgi:PST family polysaccharide transporter/lipopolysaccharide exporter